MSKEDKKRYYWLKLDRRFFKRHDVKIIEAMENGKDYILLYLKLLCEATSHEGELRFSETIPYDEKMLSVVTDTNIDIVKSAMDIFISLGMMEVLEDRTIYMTEMSKMIGSETHAAARKRSQRSELGDNVPCLSPNCRTEKEKEKEKEKESCSIWQMLQPEEVDSLYDTYEEAGNLIQAVHEDVKCKGKKIENPYSYICGYAINKGWPRLRRENR